MHEDLLKLCRKFSSWYIVALCEISEKCELSQHVTPKYISSKKTIITKYIIFHIFLTLYDS